MALAAPATTAYARTADREIREAQAAAIDDGSVVVNRHALLHASFAFFMGALVDESGRPLRVDEHHVEWAELFQHQALLCLLAPRDHGKTWTEIAYLLWRVWRHNRDPLTGQLMTGNPEGKFEAVLFSLTLTTAEVFFELFQNLLWANLHLFEDIRPRTRVVRQANEKWSRRQVRLRNLASVIIRGFRSSARGLHPDLIILDDVLDDQTTLTQYQRDKAWRYFAGTLIPMAAKQYIVIGTAFHLDDLLHRLRPRPNKPVVLTVGRRRVQFRWVKYRSVNWDRGTVLWEWKHDLEDLRGRRALDPLLFSREMQNDPIDDASSLFPYSLTGRTKREDRTFIQRVARDVGDYVLAGEDLAVGATASSDYTVLWVAVYNRFSGRLRVIWGERHQALEFDDQIGMLRAVCRRYAVDLVVVESNTFQTWLRQTINQYPETRGRVVGHRTGTEKADFNEGVPSMRLSLEHGLVDFPAGDDESAELFGIWQAEMAAFGWKDGKLMGIGEHDDTVMAWYMLDRAKRLLEEWLDKAAMDDDGTIITGEDLGIAPVVIGKDYY